MKPTYLLFAGDSYYPSGGMDDFKGAFDSMSDAMQKGARFDWAQIAVIDEGEGLKTIREYASGMYGNAKWVEGAGWNDSLPAIEPETD